MAQIYLVYDKQCPMCHQYCRMARIRKAVGELILVDARTDHWIMKEISEAQLDIDQGMVLKIEDTLYYGSDAIHALAMLSGRSDLFNRFTWWLFKSKSRAKWLYPFLRSCRNFALKLLGVGKINNLDKQHNDTF